MKTVHAIVIAAGLAVLGAATPMAQAPATPRPPQGFTAYLQGQYAMVKRNISGSTEKMPAEHFSYRPVPEVMTYGELISHVLQTQFNYCNAVKGGPNPAAGKDFKQTDKVALIQLVKDSFAYCDDAFANLSDANALEIITSGTAPNQRQIARANQLTQLVVHGNEHYGNLITYMRTKGIVPPSSTPQ